MSQFMVLIQPWGVYVKDREFFIQQGGLRESWGKAWRPVEARDIESARRKGKRMYRIQNGKRVQFEPSPF